MKINRFNENNDNFKMYFKKYKCDITDIEVLHNDIKDLIKSGNLLYSLYYSENDTYNFMIYSYMNDRYEDFIKLHDFIYSKYYKNSMEVKNSLLSSSYKNINKEDIDLIYMSSISNKFNL